MLVPLVVSLIVVRNSSGPKSKFDIIQPVLQFGVSGAGGGEFWSISSWYVPEGGWFDSAIYSEPLTVEPGDTIFGNVGFLAGCCTTSTTNGPSLRSSLSCAWDR